MQPRNHTKHRRPLPRLRFLKEEVSHVHLQYIHTWAVLQTTTAQKKITKYKQELNESMPKKATDGSKSGTVEGQCYNRNRSVVPQSDGTCIYHCLQATFNLLFPALLVFSNDSFQLNGYWWTLPLHSQGLNINSPYSLLYIALTISENLVLNQTMYSSWLFSLFSSPVCLTMYIIILQREITFWSFLGVKRLGQCRVWGEGKGST